MKIQPELLKLKDFNPLQKLILGLIIDTPQIVFQYAGGYDKTCSEIGKELDTTRTKVKVEVEALIECGLITSRKGNGWRITNITKKTESFLNCL